MRSLNLFVSCAVFGFLACIGEIPERGAPIGSAGNAPSAGASTGSAGGAGERPPGDSAPPSADFDPGPPILRRLTNHQLASTMVAALGLETEIQSLLLKDRSLDAFANGPDQASPSVGLHVSYAAAARVSAQAATAPGVRERLFDVGKCGARTACLDRFVQIFGRRLFRRPVEQPEAEAFAELGGAEMNAENDFWAGARLALEIMLQSVPFLYVVESGEPDPVRPELLRRDGWALATRLALTLWQSGPDEPLLDAAARNTLRDPAVLAAQVGRMLDDPRALRAQRHFFREWLGYDLAPTASKEPVYAEYTAALTQAMVAETDALVDDFLASKRRIMDIFAVDYTLGDLAIRQFYRSPGTDPSDPRRARMPDERRGILGNASFIAANSGSGLPSPTLRGLAVMNRFLCGNVAPPPPNAPAELPEPQDKVPRTVRERTELIMLSNKGCNYCHNYMDPVGFLFEDFDSSGKFRTTEPVPGAPGGSKAVDSSGSLLALELSQVNGLPGLGAALATHETAYQCMLTNVLSWSLGREVLSGDDPILGLMDRAARMEGGALRGVLAGLATSPAMLYSGRSQ